MPHDDNPYENDEASPDNKADKDTALLPKSFFAGKKLEPGSKCEVEIDHVYDDEVAVKYVARSSDDETEKSPDKEEEKPAERPVGEEASPVEESTASPYD